MKAPLTKEQFCHYINFVKERSDSVDKINELFTKEFADSVFYPYCRYETELLNLLKTIMQDDIRDSDIDYFFYETDCGKKAGEYFLTLNSGKEDEREVHFYSPEDLYDWLIEEHFSRDDSSE